MLDSAAIESKIRTVLAANARLEKDANVLNPSDDLYAAGMTSHASVNVMLALEAAFSVEFPDAMLTRSVFVSIAAIGQAVCSLLDGAGAA